MREPIKGGGLYIHVVPERGVKCDAFMPKLVDILNSLDMSTVSIELSGKTFIDNIDIEDISLNTAVILENASKSYDDDVKIAPNLRAGRNVIHMVDEERLPDANRTLESHVRIPDITIYLRLNAKATARSGVRRAPLRDRALYCKYHALQMAPLEGKVIVVDLPRAVGDIANIDYHRVTDEILNFTEDLIPIKEFEQMVFEVERVHIVCMEDVSKLVHKYDYMPLDDQDTLTRLIQRITAILGNVRFIINNTKDCTPIDTSMSSIRLPHKEH